MTVTAILLALQLVWPFFTVAQILPLEEKWKNVAPYNHGAYAQCNDMTIRFSEDIFQLPPIIAAAFAVHEQTHLNHCGTNLSHYESIAYTQEGLFLDAAPDDLDPTLDVWRQIIWARRRAAVEFERQREQEELQNNWDED